MDENFNTELFSIVSDIIPKNAKLLYLSLTGSRGKNLSSEDSDYDFKAIVQYNLRTYLLKEKTQPLKIKDGDYKGLDVEGSIIDLFTAVEYAMNTNPFIIELIGSYCIFSISPDFMEELKKIFIEFFSPLIILKYYNKQIEVYLKKGVTDSNLKFNSLVPCKHLVEVFYYILLKREFFFENFLSFSFKIDDLLKYLNEDEGFIKDLIMTRKKNRNEFVSINTYIENKILFELKHLQNELDKLDEKKDYNLQEISNRIEDEKISNLIKYFLGTTKEMMILTESLN